MDNISADLSHLSCPTWPFCRVVTVHWLQVTGTGVPMDCPMAKWHRREISPIQPRVVPHIPKGHYPNALPRYLRFERRGCGVRMTTQRRLFSPSMFPPALLLRSFCAPFSLFTRKKISHSSIGRRSSGRNQKKKKRRGAWCWVLLLPLGISVSPFSPRYSDS